MFSHSSFQVNAPDVVHESFDDEAVVLNLKTGNYYSLNETGKMIWQFLEAGGELKHLVTGDAGAGISTAQTEAINGFISDLLQEGLMVPREPAASAASVPFHAALLGQAPQLRRYEDMQALFLLDPIHEVQEGGWPLPLEPKDEVGA